ncbi:PREDICTED: sepiapterin reductase-like [Branchiostoma belcheri]|uniref:Sepiapterin reductase n=1 Tax=Branchiostoma belcheri TaxID=7741 RepID=A0A6P4ZQ01_BRABE|nr:PREDICTED: sepiapterin reductase-like [Branchiostoma belcheri]
MAEGGEGWTPPFSKRKSLCVITGGSKGFGRSVAVALAAELARDSHVVVLGRNSESLRDTEKLCKAMSPHIQITTLFGDLSKSSVTGSIFACLRFQVDPTDYKHALLVNNAGTVGNVSRRTWEHSDPLELDSYFNLNVASAVSLTGKFLEFVRPGNLPCTVVNVTCDEAQRPMKCHSLYCAGKAAREMMFKVMAQEEPHIRILNYNPGPLETELKTTVMIEAADDGVREEIRRLRDNNQLIDPDMPARKLVQLLKEDLFKSGEVVNFQES